MSNPEIQTRADLPTPASNSIDRVFSQQNFETTFVALVADANALVEQSSRVKGQITTVKDFSKGIDAIKLCNTVLERIDEARRSVTDPVNARIKWWNAEVKKITDTVEIAKTNYTTETMKFKREEDARRAADAEKERRLAEEQALADAQAAADAGDKERAEQLLSIATATPNQDTRLKGRGTFTGASGGSKLTWKGEVADVKVLCRAIADGNVSEKAIKEFSKSWMNSFANTTAKEGVFHGIKCFEKEDLNVR